MWLPEFEDLPDSRPRRLSHPGKLPKGHFAAILMHENQLKFALQAASRIQGIVDDLCSHTNPAYHQFCTAIRTELFEIVPKLQSLPDTESSSAHAVALLDELEWLCCRAQSRRGAETSPQSPYPALGLALKDATGAAHSIIDFASDRKRFIERRKFLACLRECVPADDSSPESDRKLLSPSNADVQAESEERLDCGREISYLHKTLSTYCFCVQGEHHHSVAACIRLSSSSSDDSKVTFGVLFMDHPHQNADESIAQPHWQDTEISLYRTVQTGTGVAALKKRRPIEAGLHTSAEKRFCHFISERRRRKQAPGLWCFAVTRAAGTGESGPEIQLIPNSLDLSRCRSGAFSKPSISLRSLLETASNQDLTEKKKEVLSVFLAKAAWQYYSSQWMAEPWNKDTVHFIPEKRNKGLDGIFVDDPLLSISIRAAGPCANDGESAEDDDYDDDFLVEEEHKIPKLKALGIMLVEIQLGRPIESLYSDSQFSHHCPGGFAHEGTNYNICKELIEHPSTFFEEKETSGPMSDLIRHCIFPSEVFMPPRVKSLDDDDIRDALYNLVNRLEVWNSKRQPHNVRPLSPPGFTPSNTPGPGLAPPPRPTLVRPDEEIRHGRTMAQITNSKTTEAWLSRMRSLIYILEPATEEEYRKVRVAVLDTGVYPNHAEAEYIQGYRDFVSGDHTVKRDNSGHGTTSISLILDMCESADIYALRVFEQDVANQKTQELAIQALDWCIQNDIDVVCMAFGFVKENKAFRTKLEQASRKMLVVVAPTNSGNMHDITYPARHEDLVLPMFATSGNIKSSAMNPSQGLGKYDFAILGEDIKNANNVVNSGTSYATAIATGLAARLLDFSRHGDTRDVLEGKAHEMKSNEGMKKLLLSMTTLDSGFWCIRPWDLLAPRLKDQIPFSQSNLPKGDEKKAARGYICQMISFGIDGKWGSR